MNFFGKILKNCRLLGKCHYRFGKNSAVDWLIVVAVFIIFSTTLVILALRQFSDYKKDGAVLERFASATSTVFWLDREKLGAATDYFAAREKKFNEIKTTKPRFIDPSK